MLRSERRRHPTRKHTVEQAFWPATSAVLPTCVVGRRLPMPTTTAGKASRKTCFTAGLKAHRSLGLRGKISASRFCDLRACTTIERGEGKATMETATAGLEGVIAGESEICYIDGYAGVLSYRGYNIHTLADHADIRRGHLPAVEWLAAQAGGTGPAQEGPGRRARAAARRWWISCKACRKRNPMDVLRTARLHAGPVRSRGAGHVGRRPTTARPCG